MALGAPSGTLGAPSGTVLEGAKQPRRGALEPVLACYLLRSLASPGKTYIGFTVGPCKRLRQHNGEVKGGARRTKYGRPWEMVAFVHGFSSKVHALQFEWAWQNPTMSRFLKGTGALDHLRVTKRSFAASTRLQVLAALLAADEFANEQLGIHVLRGVWATGPAAAAAAASAAFSAAPAAWVAPAPGARAPAPAAAGARRGPVAPAPRIAAGEGADKLEELLRRELAQTPRAGGRVFWLATQNACCHKPRTQYAHSCAHDHFNGTIGR